MKKQYKNKFTTLVLLFLSFFVSKSFSQCGLTYYAGIGVASTGTAFATWSNFGPGQYFAFPVLSGGSYAISTCGATIDTQLSGYDASGTNSVFYNDDLGPLCNTAAASVDNYVPNFTNYMYIQVTQYNCAPGGSSSINLYLRQNDNINFTSSSSAMCSGQTRILTATPANVGSTPGGYGNPGTFSGTGVSANIFTAPVVSVPTNYTVTYTFGYVSHTQVLTVNPNPTITVTSGSICSSTSYTMVPSGASTYTFQGGSAVVSPLSNTNYTVTGTSSAGCISTGFATSNVTVVTSPVVSVNSGSICSGTSFTMVPSGANTYTFQGGNAVVSPLSNTSYTVRGSNTAGCVSTNFATSNVTVNALPVISVNSGSICSGSSFTMVPSGASTYTFQGGNAIVSPLSNTSYTVRGTSSAGCVASSFATSNVTVNALPVISVNSGSICSGNSFTIVPSGASSYTYQGGNAVVSPLANASYTVRGSSAAGCASSNFATSNVTVIANPTITVNSGSICSNNSFTIVPSGANSYTIQGGNASVSPLTNTTYTVIGTSSAGCVSPSFATSSITVSPTPTIAVNSGSICSGNTFTIVPSGASSYTLQGGSATVSPIANASYTVIGVSAAGCVSQTFATANVTVNATPTITVNSGSVCAGMPFTLTPSGAATYTIQGGNAIVSPTANASYTVIGSSIVGCAALNSATATIVVNSNPTITVNSGSICPGASFTITPSGAMSYTFETGNAIVTPTASTNYTVIGADAIGCISQASATSSVTIDATPLPTVTVNSGAICLGSTFTMVPAGASTYIYEGGSATVSPTANATYTVIGLNAAGCSSDTTATSSVTVNPLPSISIVGNNTICLGESATLKASGGDTYSWSDNSSNTTSVSIVTPTATTSYSVVGTESTNGCSSSANAEVVVIPCTGIANSHSGLDKILVYPNPNNGVFTIELNASSQVIVTNALGQEIVNVSLQSGKQNFDIQVQDKGIYFVKVIEQGNQQVIKIIKQ